MITTYCHLLAKPTLLLPAALMLSGCGASPVNTTLSGNTSPSTSSNSLTSGNSALTLPQSNNYNAPKASQAPTIDGNIDSVWNTAPWQALDVLWLGAQVNYPTSQDFSGRFKLLWDESQLYLLMDVTDDVIHDHYANPLDNYWNDDTVELFIDPDHSGGSHTGPNFDNAWAYHVSTFYDVVDSGADGTPKLFNDHITAQMKSDGTSHIWEMSIRIYNQGYSESVPSANVPATLHKGMVMGFSASYIDNDNQADGQRESMMGSVDTIGHKENKGYLDASVLGTLTLTE